MSCLFLNMVSDLFNLTYLILRVCVKDDSKILYFDYEKLAELYPLKLVKSIDIDYPIVNIEIELCEDEIYELL